MASPGRDIKLSQRVALKAIETSSQKYGMPHDLYLLNGDGRGEECPYASDRSFADRWILSRLNCAIRECTETLEEYRFDQATSVLYQFLWHEYCDWYIELIKPALHES